MTDTGKSCDVKMPPSRSFEFDYIRPGNAVLKQIRIQEQNRDAGESEYVKVILGSTYLKPADHDKLWNYIRENAEPEELDRIIELNVRL